MLDTLSRLREAKRATEASRQKFVSLYANHREWASEVEPRARLRAEDRQERKRIDALSKELELTRHQINDVEQKMRDAGARLDAGLEVLQLKQADLNKEGDILTESVRLRNEALLTRCVLLILRISKKKLVLPITKNNK